MGHIDRYKETSFWHDENCIKEVTANVLLESVHDENHVYIVFLQPIYDKKKGLILDYDRFKCHYTGIDFNEVRAAHHTKPFDLTERIVGSNDLRLHLYKMKLPGPVLNYATYKCRDLWTLDGLYHELEMGNSFAIVLVKSLVCDHCYLEVSMLDRRMIAECVASAQRDVEPPT